MKKWFPWLCLVLVWAVPDAFAAKQVVIDSVTISGPAECTLVIPPKYPEYCYTYTCTGAWHTEGELDEEKEEEEPVFKVEYAWSAGGCVIEGPSNGASVTVRFQEGNGGASVGCLYSVVCTSGAGSGDSKSATMATYLPVWDSGNPISAYLEGTTMTPNSRRAVTMNGTLSLSVSLSSYGEQDRREGATVTTPWDSIVHAGGGGYSGGGKNGIAAVGGAATADAGEEGESTATGSPYWIASAGSFPEGNVGESVTWKAPDTPSNGVIIQVVVDDLGQKPENEAGSADDTAVEAGRMLVDVVKTSIVRTASWIKVNDDDDDGNGTADMDDDEAVENEDDLRAAFTLDLSPSGLSDGTLVLSDKSDTPRIRVWMTSHEGTKQPLALPKEWSMSEFGSLPDKTLYVERLQPSLETDDVTLELKYAGNGCTTAATASLTVVRLDLDADANYDGQRDIADEHLEDNPGLIVLLNDDDDNDNKTMDKEDADAVENEDDLQKITLAFAPAALPNATLKLETSAGSDSIKIWAAEDKSGEPLTLPKIYRPAAAPAPEGDDPAPPLPSTLYVEGIAAGDATLKLSFVNDDAIYDEITLHVVKIGLLPDFNRDRKIDDEDQTLLITKGPFRFWVNDDEDDGDVADDDSDIPGANDPNHEDNIVNGRSDLLDFFPVWINVEKIIEKQPPDITFQFCLRQDDSALKIVYTTLTPGNAGSFLTAPCTGCGPNLNQSAEEATTTAIGASAVFPECFVDELENGNGVVMAEGTAASSSPLVLEIRNGNHIAFARKMPMSLSGVEDMFRLVNLRYLSAPGISLPLEPENLPDEVTDETNIFFLHGFRVDVNGARGWNSEMFKRLWQSASNSRYWGVTWNGDAGVDIFNYHNNVVNAFLTANKLKALVNDSGIAGTKIVMAHSLGNMVVCSAIVNHTMSVSKYFMLNAAIPSEAFNAAMFDASSSNALAHSSWSEYLPRTWSASWHLLFAGTNDARAKLTWKERFSNMSAIVYNCHSSEDEVLELYSQTPDFWTGGTSSKGRYSWHKQESFKGRAANDSLAWAATDWSGWGFRMKWIQQEDQQVQVNLYSPAEANAKDPDELKSDTVFPLLPTSMNSSSISRATLDEHLAKGIPALSKSAGLTAVGFGNDINMAYFRTNGWGRNHDDLKQRWLHSDLKDMAYFYVESLFSDIFVGSVKSP